MKCKTCFEGYILNICWRRFQKLKQYCKIHVTFCHNMAHCKRCVLFAPDNGTYLDLKYWYKWNSKSPDSFCELMIIPHATCKNNSALFLFKYIYKKKYKIIRTNYFSLQKFKVVVLVGGGSVINGATLSLVSLMLWHMSWYMCLVYVIKLISASQYQCNQLCGLWVELQADLWNLGNTWSCNLFLFLCIGLFFY